MMRKTWTSIDSVQRSENPPAPRGLGDFFWRRSAPVHHSHPGRVLLQWFHSCRSTASVRTGKSTFCTREAFSHPGRVLLQRGGALGGRAPARPQCGCRASALELTPRYIVIPALVGFMFRL